MRRPSVVLLPLAVVLALALWRAQGPAPKPETAPPSEFSSARAMKVLRGLLVDGVPHPIATRANERVRSRVVTQFRALGYQTSIQRRFACDAGFACGTVENIIARMPGSAGGNAVLVAAHYDSVPAGPGASDDGMGVAAVLETARAIRGERFRNPVIFLVDDGEEAGLLGAEAFVADPKLSGDVAVVINLENRGTYGPSNMFETSRGNLWIIRQLAGALDRPQASSLFYAIYDLLPNDTDVTVFKREGKAAVNYAAIQGVNWYHTPLDDLNHASPRTLQHHGENLLATTRALANADLDARTGKDATYFDILGFYLVWWPQQWTLWIAIGSLVILLFAARKSPPRAVTFGVLAAFTAIVLAAAGGFAVAWLSRLRSEGINFVAHPTPSIAAMWLTGIAAALFGAALFRRRSDPQAMLYGIAIVWNAIGIALAVWFGGGAFLFVVPAVAVSLCALARADALVTSIVSTTVAAILFFPLGITLYDALGGRLMIVIAIVIGALATLSAPLFARARGGLTAAILALVCAGIALALPPFSPERPRQISLSYIDDPLISSPQWVVTRLTDPLRKAAAFAPADPRLTPWSYGTRWAAPAPPIDVPRVTMTGERTESGVTFHIRSPRDANRIALLVRGGDIRSVNGVTPPPRPARFRDGDLNGWRYASASGVAEMTVDVAATGPVEAIASDTTFGLPAWASDLLSAREASTAIPIQDGDVTITRARIRIEEEHGTRNTER